MKKLGPMFVTQWSGAAGAVKDYCFVAHNWTWWPFERTLICKGHATGLDNWSCTERESRGDVTVGQISLGIAPLWLTMRDRETEGQYGFPTFILQNSFYKVSSLFGRGIAKELIQFSFGNRFHWYFYHSEYKVTTCASPMISEAVFFGGAKATYGTEGPFLLTWRSIA